MGHQTPAAVLISLQLNHLAKITQKMPMDITQMHPVSTTQDQSNYHRELRGGY
jgi:hypothetical protein